MNLSFAPIDNKHVNEDFLYDNFLKSYVNIPLEGDERGIVGFYGDSLLCITWKFGYNFINLHLCPIDVLKVTDEDSARLDKQLREMQTEMEANGMCMKKNSLNANHHQVFLYFNDHGKDEPEKVYRIRVVEGDGADMGIMPSLMSWDVFRSREDAERYARLYAYGENVRKYKIDTYDPEDIDNRQFVNAPAKDDPVDEVCPHCGNEVVLKSEFRAQRCPECGKWIAPCSLCDSDHCDCRNCPVAREARKLNGEQD